MIKEVQVRERYRQEAPVLVVCKRMCGTRQKREHAKNGMFLQII